MATRSFVRIALLSVLPLLGCAAHSGPDGGVPGGDAGHDTDGGFTALREPTNHRPSAMACDMTRPPSITSDGGIAVGHGECSTDSDCTDGQNGRCVATSISNRLCSYDECFSDSDCSDGGVCGCRDSYSYGANSCLPADCRVDSDCGPSGSGWCSPAMGGCFPHFGVVGYFCHAANDECVDDSDCQAKIPDAGLSCVFDPGKSTRWTCGPISCTG